MTREAVVAQDPDVFDPRRPEPIIALKGIVKSYVMGGVECLRSAVFR